MKAIKNWKNKIENSIDKGVSTVEEIHQSIASTPFESIEKVKVLNNLALNTKKVQANIIGTVYDTIRSVNKTIGNYVDDVMVR
ncbi:MAG: hypothetical protein HQK77_15380 [Desulfobacterales bacterium]|nr:hypothetical protein [Desulfobacterales bacterium]